MLHVMRVSTGDRVVLFDGTGAEYQASIEHQDRTTVTVGIESKELISRELPGQLIIASALPKGDRQKVLVEKLTELGVHQFYPLETSRSVVPFTVSIHKRLERCVIEASKQCGRNELMTVHEAMSLPQLLNHTWSEFSRYVTDLTGRSVSILQDMNRVIVAIGPEGGFTDDELENARQNGWRILSFGARILRVETAAINAAAHCAAHMTSVVS